MLPAPARRIGRRGSRRPPPPALGRATESQIPIGTMTLNLIDRLSRDAGFLSDAKNPGDPGFS